MHNDSLPSDVHVMHTLFFLLQMCMLHTSAQSWLALPGIEDPILAAAFCILLAVSSVPGQATHDFHVTIVQYHVLSSTLEHNELLLSAKGFACATLWLALQIVYQTDLECASVKTHMKCIISKYPDCWQY